MSYQERLHQINVLPKVPNMGIMYYSSISDPISEKKKSTYLLPHYSPRMKSDAGIRSF